MTRKRKTQLSLFLKTFRVTTAGSAVVVQAKTRSEAKYLAFKRAQEVGQYRYEGGFLAFTSSGVSIKEIGE